MRPYAGASLTQQQVLINSGTVRQAVEWGFGKIVVEFTFLGFKKNQKLFLQDVGKMYREGTILTNCHTCLYGSRDECNSTPRGCFVLGLDSGGSC